MNKNNIETAEQVSVNEIMDGVIAATNQYEMINCLMTCMAVELGLPKDAEVRSIMEAAGKCFLKYQQAQKDFNDLRSGKRKAPIEPKNQ